MKKSMLEVRTLRIKEGITPVFKVVDTSRHMNSLQKPRTVTPLTSSVMK